MQQDPARYVDGMNLYCYLRSAPFTFSDPDGRASECQVESFVVSKKVKLPPKIVRGHSWPFIWFLQERTSQHLYSFDVDAKFSGPCPKCCEYRQYVKGTLEFDGKPITLKSGEPLFADHFVEDGGANGYGHRELPNVKGLDEYLPDRMTGDTYHAHDEPGILETPPWKVSYDIRIDLVFEHEIVDKCNNGRSVRHTFSRIYEEEGYVSIP